VGLLSLAVVGLAAAGVVQIRQDDILTGVELIGWAFLSLALLLGLAWEGVPGPSSVSRALLGPGLWPGPRRQARWGGRDSGAQGRKARTRQGPC
jgi:hypothetical protein